MKGRVDKDPEQPRVRIRAAAPADAAAIARVHVDSARVTYRGIIPDHYLEGFSYSVQQKFFTDLLGNEASFCYVAELPLRGVAGFAAGCPERTGHPMYGGELYALYILPEYQKQGIGRLLLSRIAEHFHQDGTNAMLVWVLAQNPAVNFYESVGAQRLTSRNIELGGKILTEISFGWPDVRPLADSRH